MPKVNDDCERLLTQLSKKKHVVWDWNGTLLNDVDHAVETMNRLLTEQQLPILDKVRYKNIFDFPVKNYYDLLGFDYSKISFETLCHRFVDGFMAGFHNLPLIDNMGAVLRRLNTLGVKQSILSATDQPNLDKMISHFELEEIFAHVFGIDNKMASSKVERGRQLLRVSGIPAEQTVIIGDTLHDLEVGKELGINVVLIAHGHQCVNRLRSHHNEVYAWNQEGLA